MKRRDFVKTLFAGLAVPLLTQTQAQANQKPSSLVWEAEGTAAEMIRALFAAMGGLNRFIAPEQPGATVLIKPNLCLPHPEMRGSITSSAVLVALCAYLSENGINKIIIADHTLQPDLSEAQAFELAAKLAPFSTVKFMLANQQRLYQPAQVPGRVLKQTEVLKSALKADFLINIATAKHHSATQVSLALKNLMGLIWDRMIFHTELDLNQAIADLALVIRPGLNIVDASRVLLTNGPTGPGTLLADNRLFASVDPVALDATVVSRYNFGGYSLAPGQVDHLMAAFRNGLGEIELQKIQLQKV